MRQDTTYDRKTKLTNDEFDEKEDNVYDKEEDYSGGAGHRHG